MNTSPHNSDRQFLHLITLLSVSAGMVGVCLTAIGLIGILKSLNKVELIIDDVLALASLLFLVTCVLSFVGMRTRLSQIWHGFTRALDVLFCLGLGLVFIATGLLTWVMI